MFLDFVHETEITTRFSNVFAVLDYYVSFVYKMNSCPIGKNSVVNL